jgi:hypothetical protein
MGTKKKTKRTRKQERKPNPEAKGKGEQITIGTPDTKFVSIPIRGIAPYVQNRMSETAIRHMREDMEDPAGKNERARERKALARDFEAESQEATHVSTEGWFGIPAHGIKQALVRAIDAIPDFPMTKGKAAINVVPDGFEDNGYGLVKITKGKPYMSVLPVSQQQSMNLRSRPLFAPGWEATVTIEFDPKVLSAQSVVNLLADTGIRIGLGSGRPFSKQSCGMGWGRFEIIT